jgi:hypothetical protein
MMPWLTSNKVRPKPSRVETWCERHTPTLSRLFLKYGRDGILGPLFALLALFSFGRLWEWSNGSGSAGTAAVWTLVAAVPLLLAKRRWLVAACPLLWVAAQSYLHVFLKGGWKYFLVGTVSAVFAVTLIAFGMQADRPQPR